MAVEQMRGCGYRKVGGLYLCGGGHGMDCDRLPYELDICPVCGAGVKFTRGWTWIDWGKYAGEHDPCTCPDKHVWRSPLGACPVCWPLGYPQPYGLLWVGESSYTPQSFIQEALIMGVSRKIAAVPKKLKLGETWVLLAHIHAVRKIITGDEGEPIDDHVPGVFYAFRPQSLELLIWESDAKPEYLVDLVKKCITPIIIPDGDEDHHPDTKTKMSADDRETVAREHTIASLRRKVGR